DGGAVEDQPVDPRVAFGGESDNRLLHETLDRRIADDGGTGKAFPAACLQHHEILQRTLDVGRASRGRDRHRRDILEPPALAAQLLALGAGHRALKILLALRAGREQGAFLAAEGGSATALARQYPFERVGKG